MRRTHLRLYKHWVHEGGISTPSIAHWPGGIRARNTMVQQGAHLIDLMPTCLDAAGAEYPAEMHGERIRAMEGVSLLPALRGGQLDRPGALYWEHEGNRAVRDGRWKLVSRHPDRWELYDIEADRSEMNDLSTREPEVCERLAALYQQWAGRVGVQDWATVQKAPRTAAPIPAGN